MPHRLVALLLISLLAGSPAFAVRVKDVTHLQGMRDNQLVGMGLVIGLDGTGDSNGTAFTVQSLASFLSRAGQSVDPEDIKVDNVAQVAVTATLPPFARPGMQLDVNVSSVGDAENLAGGLLIMTPLRGPDGQVYAVAQGPISTGGFDTGGGTSVSKNHPTAGKVPNGGLVEKAPPTVLAGRTELVFMLDNPDFTTAQRIAGVINQNVAMGVAQATDPAAVKVSIPLGSRDKIAEFIASVERLPVHPDQRARVIIDEKTGTVVMGEDVRISTLAIAHGNLTVQVSQTNQVSQPSAYSYTGETVPFNNVSKSVQEEHRNLMQVPEGVSLGEVVQSLNAIGVTPRDLISILQAIRASGSLQAELVIR